MRTERILIKPAHSHFSGVKALCGKARLIHNQALYYMRQSFFDGEILSWQHVDKLLKIRHGSLYGSLPAAMSQNILKVIGQDFKGFWQANKSFKVNPKRFKARPKLPGYGRFAKTASQPFQSLSIVEGEIQFPKKTGLPSLSVACCCDQKVLAKNDVALVKEIRFVPHGSCFWIEVVYREEQTQCEKRAVALNPDTVFSLDLGINNLVTIISNKPDFRPVLVNGQIIKSLNQRYNKRVAQLYSKGHTRLIKHLSVKRFCQINDYFHKVSHQVIELCLKENAGRIVIGKNEHWKQGIRIGKVNNQKFVSIPFQSLIDKIQYKAERYGIEVIFQEESYTSKCDHLAGDTLPEAYDGKKHVFSGKRIKRGLYRSANGKLLNSDVNGAIGILRKAKVIGEDFVRNLADKGCVFQPVRWQPAVN